MKEGKKREERKKFSVAIVIEMHKKEVTQTYKPKKNTEKDS